MNLGKDLNGHTVRVPPHWNPKQTFQKVASKVGKVFKFKGRSKRAANKMNKMQAKSQVEKQRLATLKDTQATAGYKNKSKLARLTEKGDISQARIEANSKRGGPIGYFARRRKRIMAKNDADIEMIKMEPQLSAKERTIKMETKADVSKTRAKGAAAATAISALSGGIASKAKSDAEAKIAQADADKEASKALVATLNTTPYITEDPYSKGSASGLITGVR